MPFWNGTPKPFALVQAETRRQGNGQHDEPEPKPEHPKYDGQLGADFEIRRPRVEGTTVGRTGGRTTGR